MKKVIAVLLVGVATVAIASDAADPTVKARQDLMVSISGATKTLGDMAQGNVPFDVAAAEAAKAALVTASGEIAARFEPQATDPKSKAKPEIWTNWDDFVAKAGALNAAATAADVSSAAAIGASMGAIGGTCRNCHTSYRM